MHRSVRRSRHQEHPSTRDSSLGGLETDQNVRLPCDRPGGPRFAPFNRRRAGLSGAQFPFRAFFSEEICSDFVADWGRRERDALWVIPKEASRAGRTTHLVISTPGRECHPFSRLRKRVARAASRVRAPAGEPNSQRKGARVRRAAWLERAGVRSPRWPSRTNHRNPTLVRCVHSAGWPGLSGANALAFSGCLARKRRGGFFR